MVKTEKVSRECANKVVIVADALADLLEDVMNERRKYSEESVAAITNDFVKGRGDIEIKFNIGNNGLNSINGSLVDVAEGTEHSIFDIQIWKLMQ